MNNSEGIKTCLSKVYFELKESETPVVQLLKQLSNQLQGFAAFHPSLDTIVQRIQSSQIELQDIASEVESINDTVLYDENRINIINDKLSLGDLKSINLIIPSCPPLNNILGSFLKLKIYKHIIN